MPLPPAYPDRTPGEKEDTTGQAIGDMLPAAIGVAISPVPIVAVVLMLISSTGSQGADTV